MFAGCRAAAGSSATQARRRAAVSGDTHEPTGTGRSRAQSLARAAVRAPPTTATGHWDGTGWEDGCGAITTTEGRCGRGACVSTACVETSLDEGVRQRPMELCYSLC